jgi:hypothetical protein
MNIASVLKLQPINFLMRTRGWTAEGLGFESRQDKEFSLLHVVQTGSGVRPTYYPMSRGGSFPGSKAARA